MDELSVLHSSTMPPDARTTHLQFRLLGPVKVLRDGERLELGSKPRALLALLLIHANQVVSTDRIIEELWGQHSGSDRKRGLWVVVSRLRSVLEPDREKRSDGSTLLTQLPGYLLSVDPSDIDVHRFEELVANGRRQLKTDPEVAADRLRQGLALWRGHPLEDFTYEPFAAAEIARLSELRLSAVEDRIEADLSAGHSTELVSELEGLVHQHPLRQRLVGHQMVALYLSGRQGEALGAFKQLRTRLAEELGLDPSAELATLEERILLDDPALQPSRLAPTPPAPGTGLSVRGYELREQIGAGAMGHVYRAFQPAVGREVAVKVIRPELANDPQFIRRFEVGAQVIAQLEHPQIVPVFDFWREPDSAFLVMRHFEHGSLRAAVDEEPLSVERAIGIIQQIGAALMAAHRRSTTHGDVKPENVLLDGDGNAYLADFGLSPSPDLADGELPTEGSDTRLFAMLTEFVLRHAVDEGGGADSVVVGPLADVIARATSADESERFADVESFLNALTGALDNRIGPLVVSPDSAINPYQGLRAFSEDDAGRFFGRERLVDRLITRLGHSGTQGRFVAVVGPSGSGKSSVVRAGVVPALRQGALVDSDQWFIVTMTPGSQPFVALADALRSIAVKPPPDLSERLAADGLSLTTERISPDPSAQIVIVVDQFEELFTQVESEEADGFVAALVKAVDDRHSGIRVIVTLRADFYDRPLQHSQLGELLRLGTEVITPMTPEEIERAITQPALEVGVTFEPGAVAGITSDMAGQSTALPLMQHVLTEMFDNRVGSTITTQSYEQLGGVSGAVTRRADALHDELGVNEQRAVRELFLRLVTVQEGAADTRRRVQVRELTAAVGQDARVVLDSFGRHRLLSFDQDPLTRSPTAEISHETLLTSWNRLRDWIDESRVSIGAQRRLAQSVTEWSTQNEDPDLLLNGVRLRSYDGWIEHAPVGLTGRERAFLQASRDAEVADLDIERRRVGRLHRLVGAVGIAFAVAAAAAGIAFWQADRASNATDTAEAQADIAQEQTLVAEAQTTAAVSSAQTADLERMRALAAATVEQNTPLAALLAIESYNIDPSPRGADAMHRVLVAAGGRRASMSASGSEYRVSILSADGATVVADSREHLDVWDLETRTLRHRIEATGFVVTFSLSHDGRLLALSDLVETRLFDIDSGDLLGRLPRLSEFVKFAPARRELAVLTDDSDPIAPNRIEFWDVGDPRAPFLLDERDAGPSTLTVDWSPDGASYLTTNSEAEVQYWDRESGDLVWDFSPEVTGNTGLLSVARLFKTDSSAVVVALALEERAGFDLFTFDTADGRLRHPPTLIPTVRAISWWDEAAEQIVATSLPGGAGGFDLIEGRGMTTPPVVAPNAAVVHVDRERNRVVTSGFLGIEIRSIDGLSLLERRVPLSPEQEELKAVSDGQVFGSISPDGDRMLVSVFDITGTTPIVEYDLTNDPVTSIDRFPGGVSYGWGEYTLFLDLPGVQVLDRNFEPYGKPVPLGLERGLPLDWPLSLDGSRHAALRPDGTVEVYDTLTGEQLAVIDVSTVAPLIPNAGPVYATSLSADGQRIVVTIGTDVWGIFDAGSGAVIREGGPELRQPWLGGDALYNQASGTEFERLDPETFESIGPPLVGSTVTLNHLVDDPNSPIIVTQTGNGTVRVWDRETGDQIGREIATGRPSTGTYIETARNGELVTVMLSDGVAVWNYDIDTWPALACELAGRNMTQREWNDFGPQDAEYRVTCPQFPANR